MITNVNFLEMVAKEKKKTFISTGIINHEYVIRRKNMTKITLIILFNNFVKTND